MRIKKAFTWYAADAVPKTKSLGKLFRLRERTSTTDDCCCATLMDENVVMRVKNTKRINPSRVIFMMHTPSPLREINDERSTLYNS